MTKSTKYKYEDTQVAIVGRGIPKTQDKIFVTLNYMNWLPKRTLY